MTFSGGHCHGKTQATIWWVEDLVSAGQSVLVVGQHGKTIVDSPATLEAWKRWFLRRSRKRGPERRG
jgi:hypothetical protein